MSKSHLNAVKLVSVHFLGCLCLYLLEEIKNNKVRTVRGIGNQTPGSIEESGEIKDKFVTPDTQIFFKIIKSTVVIAFKMFFLHLEFVDFRFYFLLHLTKMEQKI